jgi:glycogen debranching enzyme
MYEDGRLVQPPVALCEVQAYVYDAKRQAAKLAVECGDAALAAKWEHQAEALKKQFNEQFWDEQLSCYVLALDGDKNPCRVVSSNAGHCLFAGIADEDKAEKLVSRLMQPDMFSGWGVRTLSKKEKRFNPMSYHNGSVWPHDVALIASGFSKYGYVEEALKLTSALFDASLFIDLQRLPELFCGFDRRKGEGPTSYPVACSPQAWSVAAVFMLLESCLRMKIDARRKKIHFSAPVLPEGIDLLEIKGLKLDDDYADLTLFMDHRSMGVKINACPSRWKVSLVTGP